MGPESRSPRRSGDFSNDNQSYVVKKYYLWRKDKAPDTEGVGKQRLYRQAVNNWFLFQDQHPKSIHNKARAVALLGQMSGVALQLYSNLPYDLLTSEKGVAAILDTLDPRNPHTDGIKPMDEWNKLSSLRREPNESYQKVVARFKAQWTETHEDLPSAAESPMVCQLV